MPTATSKPHILLLPGAYHNASCYDRLEPLLSSAGYQTTALTLPSVGAEPPITSIAPDVEHVRSAIEPLLNDGKSIVVVMHSYSGIIGTTSLSGFAARDRKAQGLPGGVTGLVYLCAWMLDAGQNALEMGGGQGGKLGPGVMKREGNYLYHTKPIEAFYHDIPRDEAERRATSLVHHSLPTLNAKVDYAAWKDIPTTYLVCNGDVTIPPEKQRGCVEQAKAKGGDVTMVECESGHSPFLSMPDLVSKIIRRAAGEPIQASL